MKKLIENIENNWVSVVVALTLIVLPLSLQFNLYLLISLGLIGVYSIYKKKRIRLNRPFEVLCGLFFLLHFAHLFVDSNVSLAWFETEKKLSFITLPLILLNLPFKVRGDFHRKSLLFFSYGLALVGVFLLLNGYINWLKAGDLTVFYYHEFVEIVSGNAIYMSLLFCISNSILLKYKQKSNNVFHYVLVLFNTVILILLMSKVFFFLNILVILFFTINEFKKQRKFKWGMAVIAVVLVITMFGLGQSGVKKRFVDVMQFNKSNLFLEHIDENTEFNGLSLRLYLWKMAFEIIQENKMAVFFGVGPGDNQDLLNQKFKDNNLYLGNKEIGDTGYLNYNYHNQYIQTFMEVGLIGFMFLILMFGIPITHAIRTKKYLLLLINFIFVVAFITESYLSRQVGVVSFLTFNSILLSSSFKKRSSERNNMKISLFLKNILDFVLALIVVLFFLSWFIPLVSIIVWIDTKSFPIFSQKRVGQNGEIFYCYKLRTMKKNSEADKLAAQINDERITICGAFFRKYGLDEFPQFFNVLKGEMSIVGPRPLMVNDEKHFAKRIPDFSSRLAMKPGITGLSQSKGYKGLVTGDADIKRRFVLDKFYERNYTLKFDFIIMYNTILDILKIKRK